VVCVGFSLEQIRISLFGLVHAVSPLVFPFCMTLMCAWFAAVSKCSMSIVLRPSICSYKVCMAFVGFSDVANCSS